MRKSLKIIIYVLAASVFVVLATALCLPFLIDPNDFKPQIEAAVKEHTGRELAIDGQMELSLFPWLGVSTGKMSLSNAKGFKAPHFAQISQSELNVKLIPLMSKQLEISQIVFKGLKLHLSKKSDGTSNWDDLKALSKKDEEKSANPLAILGIAGLLIDDASIVFDDREAGRYSEIKNLRLDVDRLAFNRPTPLSLSLNLNNSKPDFRQRLDFSGELLLNESLDKFHLQNLRLTLNNQSPLLPSGTLNIELLANVLFDKHERHFKLSDVEIRSEQLKIRASLDSRFKQSPAQTILDVTVENFNAAEFLNRQEVRLPKMADERALNDVELDFKLLATSGQIKIQNLNLKIDETTLKGSTVISNLSEPAIEFDLSVDRLNADRYLPPEDKNAPPKVATPASAAVAGMSLLPVETLRKLNAAGQIMIEQFKVNDLKMQGFNLKLEAEKGLLQSRQTVREFYEGSYRGQFSLNVNPAQPHLSLNEHLQGIQLEPFLNDIHGESRMTGLANIRAKLTGRGNSKEAIKASLNGQMDFLFQNSAIKGFNIQKIIDSGKAILKGERPPENSSNEQSLFSKISATAHVSNGLIRNDDLLALSSRVKVTGKGQANLVSEQLAYRFRAVRIKQKEPEILSSQPVLINVSGTFDRPRYNLDIAAMLVEKNKDKIDKVLSGIDESLPEKVEDFLKNFF